MIRVVQEGQEEGGGVGMKEGGAEGEEEEVEMHVSQCGGRFSKCLFVVLECRVSNKHAFKRKRGGNSHRIHVRLPTDYLQSARLQSASPIDLAEGVVSLLP